MWIPFTPRCQCFCPPPALRTRFTFVNCPISWFTNFVSQEAAKSLAAKEQAKKPKEKEEEKSEQATEEKQEPKEKEQAETVEVKKEKEEESSAPASSLVEETKVTVKEEPTEEKKEKIPPSEPKKPLETVQVKEEKVPVKEEKFEAKYSCDNRKVAIKEGKYITISSITEARVRLKGFDKGVNTQGKKKCERCPKMALYLSFRPNL